MNKLKLTIAALLTITLLACPQTSFAGNIQLVTYYPAPQGAFDRLTLLPQTSLPTPCTIGTLTTDQTSGKIFYCHDILGVGTWGPLSNVWTTTGNYAYPTDTDSKPLIFAGIGTSVPNFKLTLDNDGGILAIGTFAGGVVTSNPVNAVIPPIARFIWYPRKAAFRAVWDRSNLTDDTNLGNYSTAFGDHPLASATASVTSGITNSTTANYGTIAGGKNNSVTGNYSTITGGESNLAPGQYSIVSGSNNQANGDYNTIGGGFNNTSSGIGATINGGVSNTITSTYSVISGGSTNSIQGANYAAIGGGYDNAVTGNYALIGGGSGNIAPGIYSFIGGGNTNTANGTYSVIGGGDSNLVGGNWAVVCGGQTNIASGNYATVTGGLNNNAGGTSSFIAGGSNNTASGNYSVIAGGDHNSVAGDYSWVGGRYMNLSAAADRTFVWGYSDTTVNITAADAFILAPGANGGSPVNPRLSIGETNPSAILSIALPAASLSDFLAITSTNAATAGNIFIVKNNGYVGIAKYNPGYPLQIGTGVTNGNGAYLTVGGVWTNTSSRKFKDNIKLLGTQKALKAFQKLDPVTYNYKVDKTAHHVGFIAEDVPDLVAEEGRKGLNAMPVTAVLTAVLKDQKKTIAKQDEILNTLENDVQSLKAELLNY